MGPAPQPTLNPEQLRLQEQAKTDKIEGIRDRVSDETRQILQRFGTAKAMNGAPAASSGGGLGGLGKLLRNFGSL